MPTRVWRRAMLELMKDPLFTPRWNISIAEERRLALERLRVIITSGLISVTDFRTNPLRIFAAHEIAALSDVSMCAAALHAVPVMRSSPLVGMSVRRLCIDALNISVPNCAGQPR